MYVKFLRLAGTVCILTTFWSGVRVFDISVFEWLALGFILIALPYRPEERESEINLSSFKLAIAGISVLTLAGIISAPASFEMAEHVQKAAKLIGAFGLTLGVGYVVASRRLFSARELASLIAYSAVICSIVAILQGQAGLFMGFLSLPGGTPMTSWTRMTGLAEHPIEMGLVSDYGVAAALGLALRTHKWLLPSLMIALDTYSMRFSASLTAVFALPVAAIVMCLYTHRYKPLLVGAVLASIATVALLSTHSGSALLLDRVRSLSVSGGSYGTVQSRQAQLGMVLNMIDANTLLFGNGYSAADLPYKMEIHNGFLASVYHFGALGVLGQVLLIGSFLSRLGARVPRAAKSALLGCAVTFMMAYMSGPPQARPSLWAPSLFFAALLAPRRRKDVLPAGYLDESSENLQPRLQ